MLFADALDALLNAARLATVETWIGRAEAKQLSSSTIELAKAEIALRDGRHMSAQTFAEAALAMAGEQPDACRACNGCGKSCARRLARGVCLGFLSLAERLRTHHAADEMHFGVN